MNPPDSSRQSSARWRRFVRLAVYAVIVLALCPFVYTRLTTPPPQRVDPEAYLAERYKPPPDRDVTELLKAAVAAFPPEPYPMDFYAALEGDWTPQTRVALQDIIHYLELPETRSALAELRKHLHGSIAGPDLRSHSAFRQAVRLLLADARLRIEQNDDPEASVEDYVSAYHLSRMLCETSPTIALWVGTASEVLANMEIIRIARHPALTPAHLLRLRQRLDAVPMPTTAIWKKVLMSERDLHDCAVASCYTDDGHGNGWLYVAGMPGYYMYPEVVQRTRIWNLLSPVFIDRKTIADRLDRLSAAYAPAAGLPLTGAREYLLAGDLLGRSWTPADGPFAIRLFAFSQVYDCLVRTITHRNAARAALAVEEFRKETGHLPEALALLSPTYLQTPPLDLFDGHPLRYKTASTELQYVVYSVGRDGVDQGGPTRLDNMYRDDPDIALTVPRRKDLETDRDMLRQRPADPWKEYDPNQIVFSGTQPTANVK